DLSALVTRIREHRIPVLVDTSGPALLAAARAGADLVKPNAEEACAATGRSAPRDAAKELLWLGAHRVVCSLGPDGMFSASADDPAGPSRSRILSASLPEPLRGNPTGAGDAAVAAFARALAHEEDPRSALLAAVATSASAVTCPGAGEIDPHLISRLLPTVDIKESS
ncbi:MAG: PfkB family carbohydrate kinase, partial [Brachybacterium sp.]|nr:PfkB family carbohydrate kinase [Brachybacterium sp.]